MNSLIRPRAVKRSGGGGPCERSEHGGGGALPTIFRLLRKLRMVPLPATAGREVNVCRRCLTLWIVRCGSR
jgi:hypothetical protein